MIAPQRYRPWLRFVLRIAFLLVVVAICARYMGMRTFYLAWLFAFLLTEGIGERVVSWATPGANRPLT
jgi:hypothetical protein